MNYIMLFENYKMKVDKENTDKKPVKNPKKEDQDFKNYFLNKYSMLLHDK